MNQLPLSAGWQLKQRDPAQTLADDFAGADGWLAAQVPGTVYHTLRESGAIPDPFYGLNEQAVQWVGRCDWLYRCRFDVPAELIAAGDVALCCDGLDTFATVWLNGAQILSSDNMFVPARVLLGGQLQVGQNELRILFESALEQGQRRAAEYGARQVWNGDPSRVYVRKAQYHYGWDWGPCLLTAGPWQPVRLEAGPRIAELHCPVELSDDLGSAVLPLRITTEARQHDRLRLRVQLFDPAETMLDDIELPCSALVEHRFALEQPQCWWPNGYGAQPLYRIVASLSADGALLDQREQRLGVRRLRLVQEPIADEPGTSFVFELNNTPIFCGGANWIPADALTTRLTAADYRLQLEQAAAANMVMLRVWGGGIYEPDVFYDLCDELGLLVWQDFMFACGMYPAHATFQASVRAEAEAQLRRLRHHPALVLWCGNNEDYQIAQSLGLYDASFQGELSSSAFPARAIYEQLLPEVCARLDPTRPYWPGSPYGGDDVSGATVGDRHTWEVWHGPMVPYQEYRHYEGRFVSEFGMEACPALATIAAYLPPEERYPQSRTMDHHNKSTDGPRRLAAYLNDTLRVPDTLEHYVYATQLVQAEALAAAYRGWRRRWGQPGRRAVAGALVWQLNDCWPVTSWAIVDYARRPKPAYYVIRRELAPLAVGLARTSGGAVAWAVNTTAELLEAELMIERIGLDGAAGPVERRMVLLAANQVTELGQFSLHQAEQHIVAARLLVAGMVAARAALWPEPFKYLALPDPQLTITRLGADMLTLRAARPAKGVWLSSDADLAWSDNMLDVLPGDPQTIHAPGLGDRPVELRWLGAP